MKPIQLLTALLILVCSSMAFADDAAIQKQLVGTWQTQPVGTWQRTTGTITLKENGVITCSPNNCGSPYRWNVQDGMFHTFYGVGKNDSRKNEYNKIIELSKTKFVFQNWLTEWGKPIRAYGDAETWTKVASERKSDSVVPQTTNDKAKSYIGFRFNGSPPFRSKEFIVDGPNKFEIIMPPQLGAYVKDKGYSAVQVNFNTRKEVWSLKLVDQKSDTLEVVNTLVLPKLNKDDFLDFKLPNIVAIFKEDVTKDVLNAKQAWKINPDTGKFESMSPEGIRTAAGQD